MVVKFLVNVLLTRPFLVRDFCLFYLTNSGEWPQSASGECSLSPVPNTVLAIAHCWSPFIESDSHL